MAKEKPNRKPVTHDDLIALFREHQLLGNNANRNKWESKFELAIREARTNEGGAVGLLTDLRNLIDPASGMSVCPPSLESRLDRTITQLTATLVNKERKQLLRRTVEANA